MALVRRDAAALDAMVTALEAPPGRVLGQAADACTGEGIEPLLDDIEPDTSPAVAEALILELRGHVGRITMVEANQVLEDVERAFTLSGMADVCRRTGIEWVNMSYDATDVVERPGNGLAHATPSSCIRTCTLST